MLKRFHGAWIIKLGSSSHFLSLIQCFVPHAVLLGLKEVVESQFLEMQKIRLDTVLVCPSSHSFEHRGWTGQSPEVPWNSIILWFCIVTDLSKLRRMRLYPMQILVLEWKGFFRNIIRQKETTIATLPIISRHITTCLMFIHTNTTGFDFGFSGGLEWWCLLLKYRMHFFIRTAKPSMPL